jgi:hypothetical protein
MAWVSRGRFPGSGPRDGAGVGVGDGDGNGNGNGNGSVPFARNMASREGIVACKLYPYLATILFLIYSFYRFSVG